MDEAKSRGRSGRDDKSGEKVDVNVEKNKNKNDEKTLHVNKDKSSKNKKKKLGRRRRGKKDVILDFSKGSKRKVVANAGADQDKVAPSMTTTSNIKKQARKVKGKLSLTTSSRDYDNQLGLPELVAQREYESTGQFFRRLDRLVAKAKVEASLDERFDTTVSSGKQQRKAKDKGRPSVKDN